MNGDGSEMNDGVLFQVRQRFLPPFGRCGQRRAARLLSAIRAARASTDSDDAGARISVDVKNGMRPVLRAGGIIEQAYYRMDGDGIGTIRITRESCAQ